MSPCPVPTISASDIILSLPAPVIPTWRTSAIFDNHNPLEIDAGCGKGRFLLERAERHPNTNFIGIERQTNRIGKVARKAARRGLSNIRLVKADISFVLANCLADASVQTIYVFFPDPWPKRRHQDRRLIQPAFLDLVARKLIPSGKLHFATDATDYARTTAACFEASHDLIACPPFIPTTSEQTDFEIIFQAQGLTAHRLSLQKRPPPESPTD